MAIAQVGTFVHRRRTAMRRTVLFFALALFVAAGGLVVQDWLGALGLAMLWAIWYFPRIEEGPPVLSMALSFQWAQVNAGVFYHGLTGRNLEAIVMSDYRPIVLIGNGCLAALLLGICIMLRLAKGEPARFSRPLFSVSTQTLLLAYLLLLATMGSVFAFAWEVPALTQGIIALGFLRLVALYLLFRRLSIPKFHWQQILPLLLFEVGLGFTGYFASFREPLILFSLVLLERFDAGKLQHWAFASMVVAMILFLGLLWLGIRTTYRSEFDLRPDVFYESRTARFESIVSLSKGWFGNSTEDTLNNIDFFIDRLWAVYYPALAYARVPKILPHEDGQILWAAVRHVLTPRLFFPNKANIASDSDMVRKYSGMWVAGAEVDTSIAFGYAAESYVDFGVPLMFLPVVVWGLLLGWLYRCFLRIIWHRELAVGLVTVIFWIALYLFERSWLKTLGFSLTLMIYMGTAMYVLDRLLMSRRSRQRRRLAALDREGRQVHARALAAAASLTPLGPSR
ncbi:MAG TPA: hypothetical protein VGE98_06550 [Thermoanaerobaculia bacterium]